MKKLVMALAVAGIAFGAQANIVRWNSGIVQGATSATDGTLSGSALTAYTINAIIWESTSALNFSAGDLYDAYEKGTTDSLFSGATVYTAASVSGASTANKAGTASFANGTTVYGAVLYTYEDDAGNIYYIENSASTTAKNAAVSVANLALVQGGGASGTATSWTVIPAATPDPGPSGVPEPTSGLLLLVGGAMLALRRKRA